MSRRTVLRLTAAGLVAGAGVPLVGCGRRHDVDVLVLGAGLAGLNAARILESQGMTTRVLEARDEIGGRMNTLDDLPGRPESGGSQVGSYYARVMSTMTELGLEGEPPPTTSYGEALAVGGRILPASEWAESELNRTEGAERAMPPWQILMRYCAADNPLDDNRAWMAPEQHARDVSYHDYLADRGASEEAIRLAGVSPNVNDLRTASVINAWRSLRLYDHVRKGGYTMHIRGGSRRLPEAMAGSLHGDVLLGRRVTGLRAEADRVEAVCADGSVHRGAWCVCALPFGALGSVAIDAPLTPLQREAMAELPYTQILQVHFIANEPYWEADGLPPALWTDGPLERIFVENDEDGRPKPMHLAWIDGSRAAELSSLPDAELGRRVLDEMARLRPASAGKLEVLRIVRWTRDNPLAGGAYYHWAPGQIARFAGQMHAPAGRLHLAGEHLGQLYTGMEAAMESGERAALEILGVAAG